MIGEPALECERLVVASPAWAASDLLRDIDPELAEALASIPSAPVAVVGMGFRDADVQHVARGFGFLAPGRENLPVLGTLFDTWVFPNRSPTGRLLTRTMIGGARDPDAVHADDAELVRRALSSLRALLHVRADPAMTRVVRHRRGIPQYVIGHGDVLKRIDARLQAHANLFLCGNSYRGVAMNACIQEAETLASSLAGSFDTDAPLDSSPLTR